MKIYIWASIVLMFVSINASENPFDLKENFEKIEQGEESLLVGLKEADKVRQQTIDKERMLKLNMEKKAKVAKQLKQKREALKKINDAKKAKLKKEKLAREKIESDNKRIKMAQKSAILKKDKLHAEKVEEYQNVRKESEHRKWEAYKKKKKDAKGNNTLPSKVKLASKKEKLTAEQRKALEVKKVPVAVAAMSAEAKAAKKARAISKDIAAKKLKELRLQVEAKDKAAKIVKEKLVKKKSNNKKVAKLAKVSVKTRLETKVKSDKIAIEKKKEIEAEKIEVLAYEEKRAEKRAKKKAKEQAEKKLLEGKKALEKKLLIAKIAEERTKKIKHEKQKEKIKRIGLKKNEGKKAFEQIDPKKEKKAIRKKIDLDYAAAILEMDTDED